MFSVEGAVGSEKWLLGTRRKNRRTFLDCQSTIYLQAISHLRKPGFERGKLVEECRSREMMQ